MSISSLLQVRVEQYSLDYYEYNAAADSMRGSRGVHKESSVATEMTNTIIIILIRSPNNHNHHHAQSGVVGARVPYWCTLFLVFLPLFHDTQ